MNRRLPPVLRVAAGVGIVVALAWTVTAQQRLSRAQENLAREVKARTVLSPGLPDVAGGALPAAAPTGGPPATPRDAAAEKDLRRSAVVRAVEAISPAVVNVNTEQVVQVRENPFGGSSPFYDDPFFRRFFEPRSVQRTSLGSGVLIDPRGYILTNNHVVNAATKVTVTLLDGREFAADPIGAVPAMDLAILKIDAPAALPAARIGTSDDLMIGETVIAIGNPFGLSHTVTMGVVSALHRSIRAERDRVYSDFIQIDASINPGNSGGPLLNINGDLIGINTAIFSEGQGIGFAIPVSKAMRVVRDLIAYGEVKQGYCGIRVQDLDDELARALAYEGNYGVAVSAIDRGSPAEGTGLARGDVIHALGTEQVANLLEFDRLLKEYPVGSDVVVHFYRGAQKGSVKLRMADFPVKLLAALPWTRMGLRVEALDPAVARRAGLRGGLVVKEVRGGSVASRVLLPGDVLLRVGNQSTAKEADLVAALKNGFYQNSIFVVFARGGYRRAGTMPLD
jgi:serine protease Do